jgi:Ca2+-dependent lipid-binding protein
VRVRTERQLAEEEEEDEEEEDEEDTPADISVMQAADLQGYLDFDGDIQSHTLLASRTLTAFRR